MKYKFFSTKEIKPTGWLKTQLEIQAKGLSGNLDKVWNDVKNSAWIGGSCEGWERVPYWLDGFIPLAYLLEDADMISRAKRYIDAIISFQNDDGWICPCKNHERAEYDTWAVLLILKVLVLYADCSGDSRILHVVEKCLDNLDEHLNTSTLRNWGAARWFEGLIPIIWLYEKNHDEKLLALAKKLRIQGFNWKEIFKSGFLDTCTKGWEYYSHIVNICMMLKSEALYSLFSDVSADEFADYAVDYLDKYHGTAAGHFSGDENLSGLSPIQGTELCGVVEAMYSYEWLFAVTGSAKWLDRLEKLAYNALPAAISPDMWSHQYVQMTNQVASFPMSKQPFRTNNNEAHLFGLEPNFGCCTANFGQGWPKFALSAFMRSENGIIACSVAPVELTSEINGACVKCEIITEYPFRESVVYKITVDKPAEFEFSLRIPRAAAAARVNGETITPGGIYTVNKIWNGTETINVSYRFETKVVDRPNNMVCVWRGPLLFSVAIGEKWEKSEYVRDGVERKYPYCDYHIFPTTKWNYMLADNSFEIKENCFTVPFSNEYPPIEMTAKMFEVDWSVNCGHCDEAPENLKPQSSVSTVRMIPYGCTNLRMTEIPAAVLNDV